MLELDAVDDVIGADIFRRLRVMGSACIGDVKNLVVR